jgi:tetratricopeptide (TPR) repeat protein
MMRRLFCATLLATVMLAGCASAPKKGAIENKPRRQPLTTEQKDKLMAAVAALQQLTDEHQDGAVKAGFKQVAADLPQIAEFDLKLFGQAEVYLAKKKYDHAARTYKKMVDDYPESELRNPALARLFKIGSHYLEGPVVLNLIVLKVRGFDRGIKILDDVSEEVGLQDPNGLGIKAALAVARSYEHRTVYGQAMYEEAYLKWSEIGAVWETGPLGKEALLGMARNKLGAYNAPPPGRRHLYDGSNLTAARTYYLKFQGVFPQDANEMDVKGIVAQIDRDMAFKQLAVGQYYHRIGKLQAANLYYDMVIRNWPAAPAAQTARELLAADQSRPPKVQ